MKRSIMRHLAAAFVLAATLGAYPAAAAENNSYRAGYVTGYQDAQVLKPADPELTYGTYAARKRDELKAKGEVPISYWRGLKDGFRDAVRGWIPKFTLDRVDLQALPPHLRPEGPAVIDTDEYKAGYLRGYREAPEALSWDDTETPRTYARRRSDELERGGPVPPAYWRGLMDGFRDAQENHPPRYTEGDVDWTGVPEHLSPPRW
jgi:hypothetical protein